MRKLTCAYLALLVALTTGCATPNMYDWGSYERDLYRYYKNPENLDVLEANLAELLEEAEQNQAVPPGLHAEYGYLKLEMGDTASAIRHFEREKLLWPESTQFMNTLIASASQ